MDLHSDIDFHDLVENLPALVIEFAADARATFVNRAAREAMGFEVGGDVFEICVPEDRDRARRNLGRLAAGHQDGPALYRVLRGAERVSVLVQTAVIRTDAGPRFRALAVVIDDLGGVDALIRRSEDRLRRLLSAFPDLIVRTDGSFRHRDFYTKDRKLLVAPPEEMVGRHVREVLPAPAAETVLEAMVRARDTGEPVAVEYEHEVLGQVGHYEARAVFSPPDDFFLIVRNVTQKKRAEARLAMADRLASLGTLVAGLAHEVNNPLTWVLGNLELLEEQLRHVGPSLGEVQLAGLLHSVGLAREGGERMRRIVSDLRAFARPLDDSLHPVDVVGAVESALTLAANEIRHRARLVRRYEHVPKVLAIEHRLQQVFLNLLVNAAQALPDGEASRHTIQVTVDSAGPERVAVTVSDDGPGIAADLQARLFDPFVTTKPPGKGMGLGLSISHSLVRAFDGELTVRSEPGHGAAFTVLLRAVEDAPVLAASPEPAPTTTESRLRVLVVDDEPLVLETIVLGLRGHDVTPAASGREALELARAQTFDVILCDLMMPEVSGIEVYGALAREAPQLVRRMAFLTGGAFTDRARAFLAEVDVPVLRKPFRIAELRAFVARATASELARGDG